MIWFEMIISPFDTFAHDPSISFSFFCKICKCSLYSYICKLLNHDKIGIEDCVFCVANFCYASFTISKFNMLFYNVKLF